MSENTILQALGRIEGKVDEIKESAREHREDDKRRFTEVHAQLDALNKDVNQAKGAKGALLWLVGGGAAAVASVVAWAAQRLGGGQ